MEGRGKIERETDAVISSYLKWGVNIYCLKLVFQKTKFMCITENHTDDNYN